MYNLTDQPSSSEVIVQQEAICCSILRALTQNKGFIYWRRFDGNVLLFKQSSNLCDAFKFHFSRIYD